MAPMTVKAYLLGKEEATREIRRFALDRPARFQPIRDKVAELFQGLLRNANAAMGAFQMYYKGGWRIRAPGWRSGGHAALTGGKGFPGHPESGPGSLLAPLSCHPRRRFPACVAAC